MSFSFPFCPNRSCTLHYPPFPTDSRWYIPWGRYFTLAFGEVPRFRCLHCGKTFSSQTFSLDYYSKRVLNYRLVERMVSESMSIAGIGRWFGVNEKVVRNKVGRLSRQALGSHGRLWKQLRVTEDLVADGIETWCRSQYHPGHLNVVVGKDSQMVYWQDYVGLKRKGKMREEQKRRREEVERKWPSDPQGLEKSFECLGEEVDRWMEEGGKRPVVFYTDEHPAYVRGLAQVVGLERRKAQGEFEHKRLSSQLPRTRSNPLFSVNYIDREIRKDQANYVRETTRAARNVNDMMQRLSIYRVVHNYRKAYRLRPDQREDRVHGEVAGIPRSLLREELSKSYYTKRRFLTHLVLTADSWKIWTRMCERPSFREGKSVYIPRFILD
ncbi:MAG: hypothetical protein SNJ78_04920 [Spirochaetales bacterium]